MYDDPNLPLVVDIGSGYGRFLLLLQRNNAERPVNYLGIEIRKPVRQAKQPCGAAACPGFGWRPPPSSAL